MHGGLALLSSYSAELEYVVEERILNDERIPLNRTLDKRWSNERTCDEVFSILENDYRLRDIARSGWCDRLPNVVWKPEMNVTGTVRDVFAAIINADKSNERWYLIEYFEKEPNQNEEVVEEPVNMKEWVFYGRPIPTVDQMRTAEEYRKSGQSVYTQSGEEQENAIRTRRHPF